MHFCVEEGKLKEHLEKSLNNKQTGEKGGESLIENYIRDRKVL